MIAARPTLACLTVLWCLALGSTAAGADFGKRYALVVGNSAYDNAEALPNAARDATQIAQALSELQFEVFAGFNLSRLSFDRLISDFARQVEEAEADTVMIYYAGHGFELNGLNRLVPVDAELHDRAEIESETFVLDDVIASVQSPQRRTIVFLDACRDSPLPASLQKEHSRRGLAEMRTGDNSFVAFATQPGNTSYEGSGRNSPFTEALLTYIGKPGLSLSDMMIAVRSDVATRTLDRQVPWNQSSLRHQFYFNPTSQVAVNDGETGDDGGSAQPRIQLGSPPDPAVEPTRSASHEPPGPGHEVEMAAVDPDAASLARNETASAEHPVADTDDESNYDDPAARQDVSTPVPEAKPETGAKRSPEALIEPLQTKLQRIGCYTGAVDGDWGPLSRAAVKRFYKTKGAAAPSVEPSEELLGAVEQESGTVCKAPRKKAVAKKQPRKKAKPPQRKQAVHQHRPRQQHNFRKRRADEIPPWEGLEHFGGKIRIGVGVGF